MQEKPLRVRRMIDTVDDATRSRMMSRIRGKNTRPEMQVRAFIHRDGFRFALHRKDLPGRPDLTLPKYCAVVFVHGCFWHAHIGCRYAATPRTRTDFWVRKLGGNRTRDEKNIRLLREMGWRVAVVWECALRGAPEAALVGLSEFLRSDLGYVEFALPQLPRIE